MDVLLWVRHRKPFFLERLLHATSRARGRIDDDVSRDVLVGNDDDLVSSNSDFVRGTSRCANSVSVISGSRILAGEGEGEAGCARSSRSASRGSMDGGGLSCAEITPVPKIHRILAKSTRDFPGKVLVRLISTVRILSLHRLVTGIRYEANFFPILFSFAMLSARSRLERQGPDSDSISGRRSTGSAQ